MKLFKDTFFLGHSLVLLIFLWIQWYFTQFQISGFINQHRNPLLDKFCLNFTYVGDFWAVIIGFLLIYFFNPRMAILVLLSCAISAGLTQILKQLVFEDWRRPLWFIREQKMHSFELIKGAEMNYGNSFPSGHTTSAFALFSVLALFSKRYYVKGICLFAACLVAFTRIYLLQHFLRDTYVGSIIGAYTSFVIFHYFYEKGRFNHLFNRLTV